VGEAGHVILSGKRVVVTRTAAQAVDLLKALQYAGAIPILLPVIRILPAEDIAALDDALRQINSFDWVLFTSQNAVRVVHERLDAIGHAPIAEKLSPRVGAVGEATAEEAARAGFEVGHVASRPLGVALVEELGDELAQKRVLLPRSDRANPDVIAALEKIGALSTEIVAYRTVREEATDPDIVAKVLRADAVLFFSPSAVEGFDSVCGGGKLAEFSLTGVVLASGPVTLAALRERGIVTAEAAKEPSVARIVEALANSFVAQSARASSKAN